jgi:hypothetical protein
MVITQKDLDKAFYEHSGKYGGVKEDYFALIYLSKEFKRPIEEVYHQVAFGGNDYGFDAFYIDQEKHNLYLYQFKWSKNHTLFESSYERMIQKGIERIFGNPKQDQRQNQVLIHLKSELFENQAIIDRIFIHFVFNGDTDVAERSAVLDNLREELEGKKFFIDNYFGNRQVTLTTQYISNDTKKKAPAAHTKITHRYSIDFPNRISTQTINEEVLNVGFVKLKELYDIYVQMQLRFFDKNIRYGLSAELSPNRSIRRSLKNILEGRESSETFVFNHNGITIDAESVEFTDDKIMITEPRVLNGAQTITSFAKFFEDNSQHQLLHSPGSPINDIRILAKIISSASSEFVVNVTICNNRQNPVRPWNLRANDKIQLRFQDKFVNDLGLYYQRQDNAFESMNDDTLEELGVSREHRKAVDIKKLAMTFLSVQGEIGYLSSLGDVFENENLYENTFRENYLSSNSKKIILCYKIQFRLSRIIREIMERGYQKYEFLGRARNLIWALLIQGILNDNKIGKLCEWYGETLTDQVDYSEHLKGIASTKIRFIIKELLKDKELRDLIDQEKYGFLRRKSTYQRCMKIAYNKYNWDKKSF